MEIGLARPSLVEASMAFMVKHEAPIYYSISDLEEDRATLERLSS